MYCLYLVSFKSPQLLSIILSSFIVGFGERDPLNISPLSLKKTKNLRTNFSEHLRNSTQTVKGTGFCGFHKQFCACSLLGERWHDTLRRPVLISADFLGRQWTCLPLENHMDHKYINTDNNFRMFDSTEERSPIVTEI